ncbi:MAG: hypothetical protein FWC97_08590 [Treponema sp.]|nr:hypothetical protein [Treponema sp.]
MKKILVLFVFINLGINSISAQMVFSGITESTAAMNIGAGDSPFFSNGFEQFANLRFQSRLREGGTFLGALNFIAASGTFSDGLADFGNPITITENFVAAIELERLHFRLRGEHLDFDGGLMRLPFGYSQVWGSSDFLNPRNPLKPDARPRGILGTALTWFAHDDLRLSAFYAAPRNALNSDGSGSLFGVSAERHWRRASAQTLYSFETPDTGSSWGIHRAGFSLKADVRIGLIIDALYTYNHTERTELDGLSLSIGADYSFFDGNLIVIAEYLFNGRSSSTALGFGGDFSNNHYLSTSFLWRFNDFTNMNVALISGLEDLSFTPIISFNYEMFQGVILSVSAQVPLDRDLFFNDGNRGEFGPIPPDSLQPLPDRRGSYFNLTARIRLRF